MKDPGSPQTINQLPRLSPEILSFRYQLKQAYTGSMQLNLLIGTVFFYTAIKTKRMKTFIFLAVIHLLCAGNTQYIRTGDNYTHPSAIADTVTLNGQWYLQPLLPADTALGKIPVLIFNQATGTFSGNTGCNNMRGSFQKTDTSLVFSQYIATTKMACTGYNEAAFVKNLLGTNKYKFDNGDLVLLFDATELSRWVRKPDKKIKINKA